ncbi:MAG TPA: hypothetical protein VFW09_01320 [Solirubrobacteraceae bacterium]|nr:hypothetical protein [Solirubrobacteraceae bacterium]
MLLISAMLATLLAGGAVAAARSLGPVAHSARVGSKIVLFKSVGGIKIGMTPKQVKRKLGKPSHTIRVGGKIAELEYRHGFDPIINVEFNTILRGDPANGVFGYAKHMHTSEGIHPGSTVKALKRAYRHHGLKHTGIGSYTIYKGHPGAPGERETDFGSTDGKIVDIGIQGVFKDE